MRRVIKFAPEKTLPHTEVDMRNIYLLYYKYKSEEGYPKVNWHLVVPSGGYDKEVCVALLDNLFTKGNKSIDIKPCKSLIELIEKLPDGYEIFEFETFFEMCKFYINHEDAYKE
jgi:hypothetical protein